MSTSAQVGNGTVIAFTDAGSPSGDLTIGEIVSFDGPGGEAEVIDATHLGSSAKEKLMGLPDEGQFSFECHLIKDNEGQTLLRTRRDDQTLDAFKITLPAGEILTFSAYVLGFKIAGGVDEKVMASVTLEISGAVTWA